MNKIQSLPALQKSTFFPPVKTPETKGMLEGIKRIFQAFLLLLVQWFCGSRKKETKQDAVLQEVEYPTSLPKTAPRIPFAKKIAPPCKRKPIDLVPPKKPAMAPKVPSLSPLTTLPFRLVQQGVAPFLHAKELLALSLVNKSFHKNTVHRVWLPTLEDVALLAQNDIQTELTESIEEIRFKSVEGMPAQNELIRYLAAAGSKGAFPNLKKITIDGPQKNPFDRGDILFDLLQSFPKLQHLDFKFLSHSAYKESLSQLVQSCPDFRVLKLPSFFPKNNLSPEELENLLAQLPNLEVLECQSDFTGDHLAVIKKCCPNLKSLEIKYSKEISEEQLRAFFDREQPLKLKRLQITSNSIPLTPSTLELICKSCPDLRHLACTECILKEEYVEALCKNAPSLVSLHIYSSTNISFKVEREIVNKLFASLKGLREFYFKRESSNGDQTGILAPIFYALTKHCPKLKFLKLSTRQVDDPNFLTAISLLRNLEYLNIFGISTFSDQLLTSMVKNCSKLRKLRISYCKNLSFEGLRSLSASCKHLQFISFYESDFSDGFVPSLENLQRYFPELAHCYAKLDDFKREKTIQEKDFTDPYDISQY